ncbi:MAG: hypothetical protein AAGA77_09640 [Bacteroidota bacterium]
MLRITISFVTAFCYSICLLSQSCAVEDSVTCVSTTEFSSKDFSIEERWKSDGIITALGVPYFIDIDQDCIPEVITIGSGHKDIVILDSRDGSTKAIIETVFFQHSDCPLAVADVDNDGVVEIIGTTSDADDNLPHQENRLICYNTNGELEWITERLSNWHTNGFYAAPGLADFNQDGIAEVYIYDEIFNAQTGEKLIDGASNGIGLGLNNFSKRSSVIAANLDDDPSNLELAAGYSIYKISINNTDGETGNSMTPLNLTIDGERVDGFTSVCDVNNDGQLDAVVGTTLSPDFNIFLYTLVGNVPTELARIRVDDFISISLITCKFNEVENCTYFYFSGGNKLYKYKYEVGSSIISKCWDVLINDGSSATRAVLFDLNNDGVEEVIYRDGDGLSIFSDINNTPELIFFASCESASHTEYPVVAGFGEENETGICLSCFEETGYNMTLFSASDSTSWVPARPLWNQYNYHVLNINDDGTVPQFMETNATYKNGRYNHFMTQASLLDSLGQYTQKAMNVLGEISCVNYDVENDEFTVIFNLENREDASLTAPIGLEVSFFSDNPETTNSYLGTYFTDIEILASEVVFDLEFTFSTTDLTSLYMVVNTNTQGNTLLTDSLFTFLECDYTDNLVFTISIPEFIPIEANICEGDSFDFNGTILSEPGAYFEIFAGGNGCDSLIEHLVLQITETIRVNQSMETCDFFVWNDSMYTDSGIYFFDTLSSSGCDSLVQLNLIINNSIQSVDFQTACDSLVWNNVIYKESNIYTFESIAENGCDSIVSLDLIILNSSIEEIYHSTCESYLWNGVVYSESGIYSYPTQNVSGCDSLAILNLTINDTIAVTEEVSVCDEYQWNGEMYTESGSYPFQTLSSLGCDSTITLELEILNSNSFEETIMACDSITWNGTTYHETGNYSFSTTNAAGCDSTVILDLNISHSIEESIQETVCDSLEWNGTVYHNTGLYSHASVNQSGCDSITLLDLTIYQSGTSTSIVEVCDSVVWNGNIYSESGAYEYPSSTVNGCDSTALLELTVNQSSLTEIELSDCQNVIFNGEAIDQSGAYIYEFQSEAGCDSTIILNALILSNLEQVEMTACEFYVWDVNGNTYNQSGLYSETLQNSNGCDSVIELNLSITERFVEEQTIEACDFYYWPISGDTITSTGIYAESFTTQSGCDSIYELDALIHSSYIISDTIEASNEYIWSVNSETYTESGVYQMESSTMELCDSIHILTLTINRSNDVVFPNVLSTTSNNNIFTAFGSTIDMIKSLSIYDKWGSLITDFKNIPANDTSIGWDGTFKGQRVAQGVYVFSCVLQLNDGTEQVLFGDITVLH